ncbi:hypothetical protein SLEP1_g723 [Rubroshorea leprosula]|uniref:Uncharacterized protein n=1 Tax=Rubroshorea leprosula TaxID=152421 RepID=A0AAV5HIF7_9ROSI|nr:hypothetical protein SLEP1_g723 [Rubroshorea leprosula]
MKPRNHQFSSRDPSPITIPSTLDFHGVATDSRANKDSSRKKRPNSADVYGGNPSGFNIDDSLPRRGTYGSKSIGPKTSEYAFFKKLKTDSSHKFQSLSINKEEYRLKKSSSSKCRGDGNSTVRNDISNYAEGTNIFRSSSRDFRPTSPMENFTCMDFDPFLSPVERAAKNSKVTMNKAFSPLEDTCSIEKWIGKDCDDREPRDIFSRKRQKLRQWVADCSFPDIDELCSKGHDFVSLLLSRLFPGDNEKNSSNTPESWSMEINTKYKILASTEQDIHFKKLHWMPTRNLAGVEYMPSLENGPSSHWSGSLKYESPPLSRRPLKELDDFHSFNGSLLGRELPALLLEWDFKNMTNEKSLAIACQNADLMGNSFELNSWDHQEYQSNEFESFGPSKLRESSILANYPQTFCPLPSSHPLSYEQYDYEFTEYILEEDKDRAADFKYRLPLTLSGTATCPYLTEDCNDETTCNGSDSFFSPESHSSSVGKVSNEEHHSLGYETPLNSYGGRFLSLSCSIEEHHSPCHFLEFPLKEIILPHLNSEDEHWSSLDGSRYRKKLKNFSSYMIDIHGWPSFFQSSLEKEKTCPLVPDNSSWEESRGEKHYDDSEMAGFDPSSAFWCGP